ncbi:MAG: hypothetical protein GX952_03525 [Firmicutes bacterium]|nr:hypothetical protein [Bacillota bacterium]
MKCQYLQGCPFYNDKMDIESGLGKLYKNRYCLGNNTKCARYMVCEQLGKEFVPIGLYPNMHEQAEEIILKHKHQ